MTKLCKQLFLVAGLAVVTIGSACAGDGGAGGDSGDNSMSQWTGDSYKAFHDNRVGDFQGPRDKLAKPAYPAAEPSTQVASSGKKHGERINPFRDDTAA
jgi:hypothetical protein